MKKRIDPDLFARLMKMSSEPRRDLLEFIGQTPVDAEHVVRRAQEREGEKPNDQSPAPR